jgi:lipopolysaccharide/colanic/teichoic acid biosynthesis glycosyltransferase
MITGDFDTHESDIPFPVFSDLVDEKVDQQTGEPSHRSGVVSQEESAKILQHARDDKSNQMVEFLASENFTKTDMYVRMHVLLLTWILRRKFIENIKRVFDFMISFFLIILFSPVMLLTALIIKLESHGPIVYKQERVGIWGKPFLCNKFRSMEIDADQKKAELMDMNDADQVVFKIKEDPRVTRVGRVIRKLSIDELPQLFNVLKGEMSLVGPRPPVPIEVDQYQYETFRRLDAVPGITGLQQVSGRSELKFQRWIELDMQYIEEQSFLKDIEILIRTIPSVISGKGAY